MIDITQYVRPSILALEPYSSARDEYTDTEGTFLDANENPYGKYNRYPDPHHRQLKSLLSQLKQVSPGQILIGNGSDEIIDMTIRIFCNPGRDKILTFSPTYGMYEVAAALNDVSNIKIPLNHNFQIDRLAVSRTIEDNSSIKIIFICSPNNPTGNLINVDDIIYLLEHFNGMIVIDEAYIDFAAAKSQLTLINQYHNLIITQTFSKAWGLAAARVGVAYANIEVINLMKRVKPPYNVSILNQEAAIKALADLPLFNQRRQMILSEKRRLVSELEALALIEHIYPSDANFLLIKVPNAQQVYDTLVGKKIITRNRHNYVDNAIRISIGSQEENNRLINAMKNINI